MNACAAVVVTYFPSRENIRHILEWKQFCTLLVIIDNTESDWLLTPTHSNHLIIKRNNSNYGLAAALNEGIKIAGQSGYNNIFLLDQDTILPGNYFADMVRFRSKYEHEHRLNALIVPNFKDRNSGTFAKFPMLMPFRVTFISCQTIANIQKIQSLIAITSGTHLTYETYQSLGPFKENYFIDFIDHEYCLRAALKGCEVVPNCHTVISHSIGKRSVHSVLGLTIKPTQHSAQRKYYFTRNSIRTAIGYFFHFPAYTFLVLSHIAHELISTLFYEKERSSKIKAMGYGIMHGMLNKMGKCKYTFDE